MPNMTIENIGRFMGNNGIEGALSGSTQVNQPIAPEIPGTAVNAGADGQKSFTQMLSDSIDKVNDIQLQADQAAKELVAGRNKNIHETMLMLEKADMSFRLMMQVRNKVIDAYREIMRMQV